MKGILICLLSVLPLPLFAQDDAASGAAQPESPQSIAELVEAVREGGVARRAELELREQRFIEARDNQQQLLQQARSEREQLEAEADRLRARYQQGEEELGELEDLLVQQSGDLNDVFSVVGQVASDAVPIIQNSLVSAQYRDRLAQLEPISSADAIPTAAQLRQLWLLLMDEMLHSGEVARFETDIITGDGEEARREVTRIGTFTVLSDGDYLRYLPESGRLLALARQPAGVRNTLEFEAAEQALLPVAVDPSRGSILSLIVQTPDISERIQQGGVIGYLILALGAIGLLLAGERLVVLGLAARRAEKVAGGELEQLDHPINAIRKVSSDPAYLADVEALSAKLDEIVANAAQRLRRGLSTLAIFAAVSPLLGLLGTVTGMIETFQVITLFGAGDPRLMSGGISQALITTQLGLAVAIPLLLLHSWLQGRANKLIADLDERAADEFASNRSSRGRSQADVD